MKLEVGNYYKTRSGEKVGPCESTQSRIVPFDCGSYWYYQEDGTAGSGILDSQREWDIVSEWVDTPVKTVSKREIVPGVYGNLSVNDSMGIHVGWTYGVGEIKQLIDTLQEIVSVLEENK